MYPKAALNPPLLDTSIESLDFIYLPLSEGYTVHLYNTVLHQCLCSDQLIVAGIVHHIQDTAFSSDSCNINTQTNPK